MSFELDQSKATYFTVPESVYDYVNSNNNKEALDRINQYIIEQKFPIRRGDLIRAESAGNERDDDTIWYEETGLFIWDNDTVNFAEEEYFNENFFIYEEPNYFTIDYWTDCTIYDKTNPYAVDANISYLVTLKPTQEMIDNLVCGGETHDTIFTSFTDMRNNKHIIELQYDYKPIPNPEDLLKLASSNLENNIRVQKCREHIHYYIYD